MLQFEVLYIFLIHGTLADLSMMLVWGEPYDTSVCTTSNSISFENCYSECYKQTDCVVAYMNESNPICKLCSFQAVDKVLETPYTQNLKTAVKINATTCPTSGSDEGQIIPGFNQTTDTTTSSYQINYNNGTWEITYNVTKLCPAGWTRFERQMGPWCIKSFFNSSATYNQSQAEAECQKWNATLTGVENTEELQFLNDSINTITVNSFYYTYWLGGKLKTECTPPNWNTTVCNNTLTMFEWTDGFTTGTDGFSWAIGYPSELISYGTLQACLYIPTSQLGSSNLKFMVNMDCSGAISYGFDCGKQPGM